MSEREMRAKMRVTGVIPYFDDKDNQVNESLTFTAVSSSTPYPADGSDENNSFARWTPSADLKILIANPALFGKFAVNDQFYVDFTRAEAPAVVLDGGAP